MRKVAKPILELSNICKKGKSGVVERLDISIPSGDSFAVVCTDSENAALLTDIIAGKTTPQKGKVFFKGDDVTGVRNVFGVIKREPGFPRLKTVSENAASLVIKRGLSRRMADVLIAKEIREFGLEDIADSGFSKLSEQAANRALIFAAYMCSHELIALDEPFSTLDKTEREQELSWLNDLRRKHGLSLLIITQSADIAVQLADYVMVVDKNTSSRGIIAVEKGKEERVRERVGELMMGFK